MASLALPIIGGVTSLLGGFLGSNAAKNAAGVETGYFGANAKQLGDVGHQQLQYELNGLIPYLRGGTQSFNTLSRLLSTPGQGLLQTYQPFQAPTGLNYQNDPGYQARMALGEEAIQNSAAAQGNVFSGDTMKALSDYGQTFGSNEYGNVYNRALQNYLTNAQNFYTGQGNEFNRLAGTAGMGLNATEMQNQARQAYQNLYGRSMDMSNQAGMAQAAGIMGSANAWQNALGGIGNSAQFYSLLNQLNPSGGGGGGAAISPSILNALPYGAPSGSAAYGLGSLTSGGGFGIGGYGQGYPDLTASGY